MFELYNKASVQKPWKWNNMKFTEAIPKGVFFNTHHGYIDLYNLNINILTFTETKKKIHFTHTVQVCLSLSHSPGMFCFSFCLFSFFTSI